MDFCLAFVLNFLKEYFHHRAVTGRNTLYDVARLLIYKEFIVICIDCLQ